MATEIYSDSRESDSSSHSLEVLISNVINSGSRYSYSSLTESEKPEMEKAISSVATMLLRLHGMQPFDRKKWITHEFTGKGMLSIPDIIAQSILLGRLTLIEKRKVPVNPDKPIVGMFMDVSGSMTHRNVHRAATLLGGALMEFFKGYAYSFSYATIGNIPTKVRMNMPLVEAQRSLLDSEFDEGNTLFSPPISAFEQNGFFSQRRTKFLFIITDGTPEFNGVNIKLGQGTNPNYRRDMAKTQKEIEKMIYYIEERWSKDPRLEYFWIQIGRDKTILDWLYSMDYVPKFEEISDAMGDDVLNDFRQRYPNADPNYNDLSKTYCLWGSYVWDQYKKRNMFYTDIDKMADGSAFNEMIDYFLHKFRKRIDT